MAVPRSRGRLRLGPVVGHTDERSTRIWIRTWDDPRVVPYALRIKNVGVFPFVSTEEGFEFGTAVAVAPELGSDRRHRYQVLRRGRVLPGGGGSFRTMPDPTSSAEFTFVAVSCSHQEEEGSWGDLAEFIEEAQPRFLVLMGDQVYLDDPRDLWDEHVRSRRTERRRRQRRADMAEKYQQSWSRPVVGDVLANIPTYMMWDDHEIRDGWGSWASDSPTLRDRHPKGADIFDHYNDYFEDARDVFWHFQMVHNPPSGIDLLTRPLPAGADDPAAPPSPGRRQSVPFSFRCGRLGVIMIDSRGDRDLWRDKEPVLGSAQWTFITAVLDAIPADIDALAVVTPCPIVTMSPTGLSQRLLGGRDDDVKIFKEGDADGMRDIQDGELNDRGTSALLAAGAIIGGPAGLAAAAAYALAREFRVDDIDDARDQWSHRFSRPEQARLIRAVAHALDRNRAQHTPRAALFLGGDIHAGSIFKINVSRPSAAIPCLTSSGISKDSGEFPIIGKPPLIGTLLDEDFEVADGIFASLDDVVNEYNFGVVNVVPTGATPQLIPAIAHSGNSFTLGVHLGLGSRLLG